VEHPGAEHGDGDEGESDVQANGLSEYYSDMLSFSREVSMVISLTQVLIWLVIGALVGVVGELLARRRAPDGIVGAIMGGVLAIFLIVGVFHFQIAGEPLLDNVPLISSIIVAAILVAVWSDFVYRRVQLHYARYYRRGGSVRRPRRRQF
jgi:uncharacterized membrane protein YeaQ/YmgE (transglycosylase-associated protein family)